MRHTRSHTRNRRSHHALSGVFTVIDKESGALRLPHRLDETTGTYRGKLIVAPKVKKERAKAEKYEHAEHVHTEPVENKEAEEKKEPEVAGTHEHDLPKARRGA